MEAIRADLERWTVEGVRLRHRLHQIPELAYQEQQTAELIAESLREYGYQPQTGVGGTGVVALLESGNPGPCIAFRADMDGLPISEENDLSYRSEHKGQMHACGHDGHVATLLLVARLLQQHRKEISGSVKLIFQPAEEGGRGSTAMIEAGVLKNPSVEALFGFHSWPGLPLGVVGLRSGSILAGNGRIEWTAEAPPSHLAHVPEEGPILRGSKRVVALAELARGLDRSRYTLSLYSVEGSAQRMKVVGIYHYATERDLEELKGMLPEMTFYPFHAPTVNTARETEQVMKRASRVQLLEDCQMVGEDVSAYLQQVPGCFFLIGAGEEAALVHTPRFDFDDRIIPIAAELFCRLALR
ncbi:MAG: M20 family metallopeptidase [Parachlamydiales bacterium]